MRSRAVVIGICLLAVVAVAVAALLVLNGPANTEAATQAPEQVTAPTATATSAPTTGQTEPSADELSELETALGSGDSGDVSRLLPLGPTETAAPSFLSTLERMALTIDDSSLEPLAADAWEVQGKDSAGKTWSIGLIRSETNQLKVVYAEENK